MDYDYLFEQPNSKPDGSEQYIIHPLALLKILVHARSGVPLEVMGLMLGEKVNEYTITLLDVFAMPQSASGVTVEAVDPVFQSDMMELLSLTGRSELSIGWYHSHPGFGCWLSSTDVGTQIEYEKLDKRAIAVVVDPIQSVKGNVVIDGFRSIQNVMINEFEICDISCNNAFLNKPTVTALMHGQGRSFYNIRSEYSCCELERRLLRNINTIRWIDVLSINNINYSQETKKLNEELKDIIKEIKNIERRKRKKEERELIKTNNEIEMVEKKEEDFLDEALKDSIKESQLIKEKRIEKMEESNIKEFNIGKIGRTIMRASIERQILVNIHKLILNI